MGAVNGFSGIEDEPGRITVEFPGILIPVGWAATPEKKQHEIDSLTRLIEIAEKNLSDWRAGKHIVSLDDGGTRELYTQRLHRLRAVRAMLVGEKPQARAPIPWFYWMAVFAIAIGCYFVAELVRSFLP